MAQFNFDASTVAPQQATGPLPAGTYLAHITESDIRDLSSGNGKGLKLTFEIIDDQFKGRKVWENLNIMHTNEDTQRISQSQLSALVWRMLRFSHTRRPLNWPSMISNVSFKPSPLPDFKGCTSDSVMCAK